MPPILRSPASGTRIITAAGLFTAALLAAPVVLAAEPPECLLPDPAKWPAPAKPYFMIAFDTSGSMGNSIGSNNSCAYPNNRLGHGRCAIKNTVQAYSGQANFGLASYARRMTNCTGATCFSGCQFSNLPNNSVADNNSCNGMNNSGVGCGPEPTNQTTSPNRAGANLLVPMLSDAVQPPPPSNVPELLSWVDNNCTNSKELFADGCTPLNGMLRDMFRYYSNQWAFPQTGSPTFPSPLTSVANGERACRSVNVILVTDGDETCDIDPQDPIDAAGDLLKGFTKDGLTWSVKTFVINFAGGSQAKTDQIAAAGGTVSSAFATNETELALALSKIIGGSVKPEVCDNTDNNCNGCTDEGFKHFCDVQPVAGDCCINTTPAQRATCLANYQASITSANPQGNLALLPCTTAAQQLDPAAWLCFDPSEKCDNIDNNCSGQADENITKCGSPLHCPQIESCNQQDDDCDGLIDEGNVCNGCVPSPEICDGCDNDCDGLIDEGISPVACGQAPPANCAGTVSCKTITGTFPPGSCQPGGGLNACTNSPQAESCDGIDNNCNGIIDDGIAPIACVPPGTPGGIVFGGASLCKQGTQPCNGTCSGFIGPSPEICDGFDNDCDGQVDEGIVGQACGINQPPCTTGITACIGGALVCQGGQEPQAEVCDGKDNDCDKLVDEAPLADAPGPGLNGCWDLPGTCCQFPVINPDITWCPPPGAKCEDNGTLSPPCNKGNLACSGAGGWICQNVKDPKPEACDGVDNDCNGKIDDGTVIQVGDVCGSDTGECKSGIIACTVGVLDCVGDIAPTPETCDGLDNDCDGVVDNGLLAGGSCTPDYDKTAYPGDRSALPCQKGISQCLNGVTVCIGGVGPSPEVCNGADDDCDGQVDEVGKAPDGLDGTKNPFPPPDVSIGEACGVDVGECKAGKYACINGTVACLNGQTPTVEQCDCLDNDCDGTSDNTNPGNSPPLCSAGKDCVKSGSQCQCASTCDPNSEFPCPTGQKCLPADSTQGGTPMGNYCVADPCIDCPAATVKDANGLVVCAPQGTVLDNCVTPPVCTCKGQNGCQDPCLGVTCPMGQACANGGPNAGKCALDNCFANPCQGCDKVCNLGACVVNPCTPEACPGKECKPSGDYKTAVCVESCATVTCPSGQACVDGACVESCALGCPLDKVCDLKQTPPACIDNKCQPNPCTDGSYCNPATGTCGNDPCSGVLCPAGQQCKAGQCELLVTSTSSASSASSGASGSTVTSSGASVGSSGSGGGGGNGGVWGLPTGGGGCACEAAPAKTDLVDARWAFIALALAAGRLRKRNKQPRSIEAEVSR